MSYFLNLFSPETWATFQAHGAGISGFRHRQRRRATEEIHVGDLFICYLVRLSRWCGVLEIVSEAYTDDTPIFSDPDPYIIRFEVRPKIVLEPEMAIPVFDDEVWNGLSMLHGVDRNTPGWGAYFQGSLRRISEEDGDFLIRLLEEQNENQRAYPFSDRDLKQIGRTQTVRTVNRDVAVEVPIDDAEAIVEVPAPPEGDEQEAEARQSIQKQAQIAIVGIQMGFKIWVPRSDKSRILALVPEEHHAEFLGELPINYNDATMRTIEQIDVIWLRRRYMARAFEVEHSTAIYSGLLRMADLLALQSNMDIRLHIVAPENRGEKVKMEIKRPVFSLLESGPLYEKCTYLSYEAIDTLASEQHLIHMSDTIIDEYEQHAED